MLAGLPAMADHPEQLLRRALNDVARGPVHAAGRKGCIAFPPACTSGARSPGSHGHCHEMRGVTGFDPHQDRMLAGGSRVSYGPPHIGGRIHGLARDVENNVACTYAMFGGRPVRIDIGDDHTPTSFTCD